MAIWLLSVLIGCLAGVLTPAAWWAAQSVGEWLNQNLAGADALSYSLALPFGMAAVLFLMLVGLRAFRSADAFTYFISDLHFQDGRRKLRYSFLHGLGSLFFFFGQAVVGIEGFCMELLSAVGSTLGQRAKLSANQVRTLAACGATAAIAAALGQPTAAFLFVIELLYGWGSISFAVGTYALTAFVAASVAQSLTSPSGFFGSVQGADVAISMAIRADSFQLNAQTAIFSVAIVSVAAAALAAFSIWVHRRTDRELHDLFESRRTTDVSPTAFGLRLLLWAVLTAAVLHFFPQALGPGSVLLHDSLSQGYLFWVAAIALLLRILMGALAYSVIGSMGLIFPTLIVGGVLGAAISIPLQGMVALSPGTFALLAMGAYFSACFGTPVAATALVFGFGSGLMTDSALFLFTSLATNFLAHYLCGKVQADRMASMGLYRHGIRFRSGMCYNTLSGIQVKDAMITYVTPLPRSSSIGDAYRKLMESKYSTLPVVGDEGKIQGVVSLADFYELDAWKKLGQESQVHSLVGVEEMIKPARVLLKPEMSLEIALEKMQDEDLVPVAETNGAYVGLLVKSDLVNLYNKEVVKKAFRRA